MGHTVTWEKGLSATGNNKCKGFESAVKYSKETNMMGIGSGGRVSEDNLGEVAGIADDVGPCRLLRLCILFWVIPETLESFEQSGKISNLLFNRISLAVEMKINRRGPRVTSGFKTHLPFPRWEVSVIWDDGSGGIKKRLKSSPILNVEPIKYCWRIGSQKEDKESVLGASKIWFEQSERWNNHELKWRDFGTCSHEAKIRIHF